MTLTSPTVSSRRNASSTTSSTSTLPRSLTATHDASRSTCVQAQSVRCPLCRSTTSRTPPVSTDVARCSLLVLQPTPFCNLRCTYCYLPHRDDTRRMSTAVVNAVAEMLRNEPQCFADEVRVLWHGGEPLAAGIPFFEDACDVLASAAPQRLRHALQTNATLVSPAWMALWRKHDAEIGVSLDGPAFLHDRVRVTP